jgi:hypothetical protein
MLCTVFICEFYLICYLVFLAPFGLRGSLERGEDPLGGVGPSSEAESYSRGARPSREADVRPGGVRPSSEAEVRSRLAGEVV